MISLAGHDPAQSPSGGGAESSFAARAGLAYLGLSVLWIFTSDGLVSALPLSPEELQIVQSSKGSLFVVVSSLVLYLCLKVWERRARHELSARVQVSDALSESEARFSQLANHIQEVFWLTNSDKNEVLYVSPGYETIWQRSRSELIQRPRTWLEAIHADDREQVQASLPLQREGRYDLTYRICTSGGGIRWIRDRAFPIRNAQGEVYRIAGLSQDITQEQNALLELRDSQLRYQRVVELSPHAIFVNCEHQIVMVNPAMVSLIGVNHESELLGRNPLELIHPEERAEVAAHIQLLGASTQARLPARQRRFLRKDGSLAMVERYVVPFSHEGKPAILVVLQDLSERHRAQQELEQQRHRLAAVIQSSLDGILMLDPGGKVVLFNPAAETIFGRTRSESLGSCLEEFIQDPHFDGQATLVPFTTQGRRANGQLFPLELTLVRCQLDEGYLQILTCRDLTQKMQMEEQRRSLEQQLRQAQKMEAVGNLAGGVAHDFNNLLTVILGNLSLLQSDSRVDVDQECLDEAIQAVHRASELTRQLLTFSRKQVLQTRELELNQVILNIVKMLRRLLGEDVQIHLDLEQNLPLILADPGMVEQVLVNLAVNARDAMSNHGDLWIETTAVEVDASKAQSILLGVPGPCICLSVRDNGCGIQADNLDHVFEPFFTTKEAGKGTGLGLSTVYGIVEQHHGGLEIESEPGKGTTLRVYWPAFSGQMLQQESRPEAVATGGHETILLVEDDSALLLLLNNVLKYAGYSVYAAACGVEALKIWEHQGKNIDLLLTDLVMPLGLNGQELARRLLLQKPQLKVLYCTGYDRARATGEVVLDADLVLEKPFTPEQLLRKLKGILLPTTGAQPLLPQR